MNHIDRIPSDAFGDSDLYPEIRLNAVLIFQPDILFIGQGPLFGYFGIDPDGITEYLGQKLQAIYTGRITNWKTRSPPLSPTEKKGSFTPLPWESAASAAG